MKKQRIIVLIGLLAVFLLAGCNVKDKENKKGPFLFCINAEGTALKREPYTITEENTEDAVKTMLKDLSQGQEAVEIQAAIPPGVKVKSFELEGTTLQLDMNAGYLKMDKVKEMLCRSAIVQTLTQIEGVEAVEFSVEKEPLRTKSGEVIGPMRVDSFVQDTGTTLKSYHNTSLALFYANAKGDKLISKKVNVHSLNNVSIEKLVVEQLKKDPATKGAKAILPAQTKVLNVSVKEGICYVNFSKEFLTQSFEAEPKVVLYGIVNSIISNSDVSRVQIAVEGETTMKFQESVSLNEPFERNLELVEKK